MEENIQENDSSVSVEGVSFVLHLTHQVITLRKSFLFCLNGALETNGISLPRLPNLSKSKL